MHRSINQINCYQRCPRQYRYRYLDQLPDKYSEHLAIGASFDDAMTYIVENVTGKTKRVDLPNLVSESIQLMKEKLLQRLEAGGFDEKVVDEAVSTALHLSKLIEPYWNKTLRLEGLEPIATQHKINYTLDSLEAPVIGFVDMIAFSQKTEELVIVDFKTTGSREPSMDYKRQVWMYSKALQQEDDLPYLPKAQLHMFAKSPPTLPKAKREKLGLEGLTLQHYPAEILQEMYTDKVIDSKIGVHTVNYDEQEWMALSEVFFDLEFSLRHNHWPKNRTHQLCSPRFCSYWDTCHSADESICSLKQKQDSIPAMNEPPSSTTSTVTVALEDDLPFPTVKPAASAVVYQQPVETIDEFLFS